MKRRLWIWMSVLCALTLVGIVVVKIRVEQRRSAALEAKQASMATIDAMLAETSTAAELYAPATPAPALETPPPVSPLPSTAADNEILVLRKLVTLLSDALLDCDGVWPTQEDLSAATEECQTLRNMGRFPSVAEKLDPGAFAVDTVLDTLKPILERICAHPSFFAPMRPLVPSSMSNVAASQEKTLAQGALALLRARDGDVDGAIVMLTPDLVSASDVNAAWLYNPKLWIAMARCVALRPFSPAQRKALLEPLDAAYAPARIKHELLLMAKRLDTEMPPKGRAAVETMFPTILFPLEFAERYVPEFEPPFQKLSERISNYHKQVEPPSFFQNPAYFFVVFTDGMNERAHQKEEDYESPLSKSYNAIFELENAVSKMAYTSCAKLDHCAGAGLVFALRDYKASHGEYPEKLDALVPEFVSKLPLSSLDNTPFDYERSEQGFVLSATAKRTNRFVYRVEQ